MISFKRLSYLTIALSCLIVAGCQDPNYIKQVDDPSAQHPYSANIGSQVEVRKNVQFADIPAPQEFSIDKLNTKTFQGSSMRFGTLVYSGIWNVWETNQWYLNAMEEAGWKLLNSKFENDYYVKNFFKKKDETVALEIKDDGKGLTIVTAMLNNDEQETQLKEKLLEKGDLLK